MHHTAAVGSHHGRRCHHFLQNSSVASWTRQERGEPLTGVPGTPAEPFFPAAPGIPMPGGPATPGAPGAGPAHGRNRSVRWWAEPRKAAPAWCIVARVEQHCDANPRTFCFQSEVMVHRKFASGRFTHLQRARGRQQRKPCWRRLQPAPPEQRPVRLLTPPVRFGLQQEAEQM